MAQDRESGLEASRYGHGCARQIAKAIGAVMVGKKSNECVWKGQAVVIKTARAKTSSGGVLYHMADRTIYRDSPTSPSALNRKNNAIRFWFGSRLRHIPGSKSS